MYQQIKEILEEHGLRKEQNETQVVNSRIIENSIWYLNIFQ